MQKYYMQKCPSYNCNTGQNHFWMMDNQGLPKGSENRAEDLAFNAKKVIE